MIGHPEDTSPTHQMRMSAREHNSFEGANLCFKAAATVLVRLKHLRKNRADASSRHPLRLLLQAADDSKEGDFWSCLTLIFLGHAMRANDETEDRSRPRS